MSVDTSKLLPWRIEAFREYLTFETLQQAAAVLTIYEGDVFDTKNPRIIEMQRLLSRRTEKDAWIPNRSGSQQLNWNVEGDVTRNKGRVFTSMLILTPKEWVENKVALTEFGRALGKGRVNKRQYYDFIISRFKYPHPAWDDNWKAWNDAGKQLYPFIYILQALVVLYDTSPDASYLSVQEIADYLHIDPDHEKVSAHCQEILEARLKGRGPILKRSDQIHRKIGDIMGFLCLTRYCYFSGQNIALNLISTHNTEKAHYWEKRKGEDKLEEIRQLVNSVNAS